MSESRPLDDQALEEIGRALRSADEFGYLNFVDRHEGEVVVFESSEAEDLEPERYVEIPGGSARGASIDDFVDTLEGWLADEVRRAVRGGRGAYRRMRDTLHRHGRLDDWHRFEGAYDRQLAREWCAEEGIPFHEAAVAEVPDRPLPAVYADHADLYDVLYGFKDYSAESARLVEILGGLGLDERSWVLVGGCGTGGHLKHLSRYYRAEGFDRAEAMVALAKRKAIKARVWAADLRTFTVERQYHAFLTLFGTIGYLLGPGPLRACAEAVARAVRPGGALIVEPFLGPDQWERGRPTVLSGTEPDVVVTRVSVAEQDGDVAVLPMHYLVGRRGEAVESFAEEHRLWLAPPEVLVDAFTAAGFERVRVEPDGLGTGRGLIVGVRSSGR